MTGVYSGMVNISTLPASTYLVKLNTQDNIYVSKFIKEN
jgi:hypothetical protein